MKYYYVSYVHNKGFGAATFTVKKFFDIKATKEYIEMNWNSKEVVILSWQEITKEQLEAGI